MDSRWYKSLEWFNKTKKVKRVLFVCSGNSCRSPAAVYYFNKFTHWWSGVSSFSRGTEVNKILQTLQARGIDIKRLMIEPESKRVIGDRESTFLTKHVATQISAKDVLKADLVLTMEKLIRDELRSAYPDAAYKIFTLKGFVDKTDDSSSNLDIGNPFIPPAIRKKEGAVDGKVGYYKYLQNYAKIFAEIELYVRKVVEIIYLLKTEKRS